MGAAVILADSTKDELYFARDKWKMIQKEAASYFENFSAVTTLLP